MTAVEAREATAEVAHREAKLATEEAVVDAARVEATAVEQTEGATWVEEGRAAVKSASAKLAASWVAARVVGAASETDSGDSVVAESQG